MDMVVALLPSLLEVRYTRDWRDWSRTVCTINLYREDRKLKWSCADCTPEKGEYEVALKEAFLKTDEDLRAGEPACRYRVQGVRSWLT